jgi:hypothetical protein
LLRVVWYKSIEVLKMLAASIITLIMEAAGTTETPVSFYQTTRRNNPLNSYLQILERDCILLGCGAVTTLVNTCKAM